jgi:hypothetical protein
MIRTAAASELSAWLKKVFRVLASLKVAIPLLVLLIAVTIFGTLFPEPEFFSSPLYLGLLGLQGISLLFVTILHVPSILQRKGRNALLGVIATHLGILVLIVGAIYGGVSSFRHGIKLIEGEITLVPGLPFAIRLDELEVEEYRQEDYPRMDLQALPKKRQQSHITLLVQGEPWRSGVAAPGAPLVVDGTTLLPSVTDIGWYFELIVTDVEGRVKIIPVRPWAPPLITLGGRNIMTHSVIPGEVPRAELLSLEDGEMASLGFVARDQALTMQGYEVSLGPVKRYTGLKVYNRPQEPVLLLGSALMFAGLVWHFYFRHRDRKRGGDDADA